MELYDNYFRCMKSVRANFADYHKRNHFKFNYLFETVIDTFLKLIKEIRK